MGDVWDFIAPVAGTAVGSLVGMPWLGAAVGSGLNTGVKTGSPLAGIGSALGSYAGSAIGAGIGPALGEVAGNTAGSLFGSGAAASTISGLAGAGLYNASLGSIVGSALGSGIGGSLGGSFDQSSDNSFNEELYSPGFTPTNVAKAPFKATRQAEADVPPGLQGFGTFDPEQRRTNIATEGVYGGGTGKQEKNYYLNLLNRRLVDDNGNVGGWDRLKPIDMSYLAQIGMGGYKTPSNLLEAISQGAA